MPLGTFENVAISLPFLLFEAERFFFALLRFLDSNDGRAVLVGWRLGRSDGKGLGARLVVGNPLGCGDGSSVGTGDRVGSGGSVGLLFDFTDLDSFTPPLVIIIPRLDDFLDSIRFLALLRFLDSNEGRAVLVGLGLGRCDGKGLGAGLPVGSSLGCGDGKAVGAGLFVGNALGWDDGNSVGDGDRVGSGGSVGVADLFDFTDLLPFIPPRVIIIPPLESFLDFVDTGLGPPPSFEPGWLAGGAKPGVVSIDGD